MASKYMIYTIKDNHQKDKKNEKSEIKHKMARSKRGP